MSEAVFFQEGLRELPEYDTKLFRQVWPTGERFEADYLSNPLHLQEVDEYSQTIYYLLFANFGNSPIANLDEEQFKYRVYETIFNFAPTWKKRLEIQKKLRDLPDEELMRGGKSISNYSNNPNTAPSTSSTEELTFVQQQTTRGLKRGKVDAYANLLSLLDEDVTRDFIERFRPLFMTFVRPGERYIYPNEED